MREKNKSKRHREKERKKERKKTIVGKGHVLQENDIWPN